MGLKEDINSGKVIDNKDGTYTIKSVVLENLYQCVIYTGRELYCKDCGSVVFDNSDQYIEDEPDYCELCKCILCEDCYSGHIYTKCKLNKNN